MSRPGEDETLLTLDLMAGISPLGDETWEDVGKALRKKARELATRLRAQQEPREPLGWVLVGWADGNNVTRITDGYERKDRAELDCEHFNAMGDGLRYTVHPVGHAEATDE